MFGQLVPLQQLTPPCKGSRIRSKALSRVETAAKDKKHPFVGRQIHGSLLKVFLSWLTLPSRAAFSPFFFLTKPQILLSEEQNLLLSLDSLPAKLKEVQQLTGLFSVLLVT